MNEVKKYIKEMKMLVSDVNIREINQHFAFGTINVWLSAWHYAMNQCIAIIEIEIINKEMR